MRSLVLRALLRHLPRHPWQGGLALLGVALGVAVAVSIDLANASATRAFELSTTALAGRATHAVEGAAGGLPDRLFTRIVRNPGLGPAAPVVEGYGTAAAAGGGPEGPTLRVLGVDPFSEGPFRSELAALGATGDGAPLTRLVTRPGTGLLTRETAREVGIEPGERFRLWVAGVAREVELLGILEPADARSRQALSGVLVMDVASAQEVLDRVGRIDRIELILPEEGRPAALDRLRALLPPDARLRPAGAEAHTFAEMTRAFRLNLTALSLLALVCGGFLIYNTMTFAVVQRRHLVGTLRTLGVVRSEVLGALLLEAAVLGAAGTLLGLVLGVGLGRLLVDLVSRTINDLYFVVSVRSVALDAGLLVRGALLGMGATVAAALVPALEATAAPPRAAQARSALESRSRRRAPRAAAVGAGLLAAGGAALAWPWPAGHLAGPFAGLFAAILGCALAAPWASVLLMTLVRQPAGRLLGIVGRMAARGVVTSLSRTGVAVAALVVAVSVTVGIGLMIASFRQTVVRWLDHTLRADVYLSPPGRGPGAPRVTDEALRRVAATPGVAGIEPMRTVEVAWRPPDGPGGGTVRLVALDLAGPARERFRLKEGSRETAFTAAARGEAVLASEPFAYRHRVQPGDAIVLLTPGGTRRFPVAGVYYDYGTDRGALLLDLAAYRRAFRDPAVSAVAARAASGTDPEELAARLRRATAGLQLLEVRSQSALRETSLAVFDRTFEITRVLRWLAGLVAFIGVLAALMALQLERGREIGVLRANGMTPGQVWRLVTTETALLGLAAGLLALPVGLLLAAVMIHVINRRSFGWTLEMALAPPILAQILVQALVLALGAALLAGVYPAWRMARTPPAEALRGE